jgi:ribosomal-protein-alanine N-acetyltransferase
MYRRGESDAENGRASKDRGVGVLDWGTVLGAGVCERGVGLLCDFAFGELNVARIEACVYEKNLASGRVLEKNGFELEGRHRKAIYKDGKLIDGFMYGKVEL